jgi:alpha-galactosidase
MIRHIYDHAWVLDTPKTTYAITLLPTGQLEHLYYGRRIKLGEGVGALDSLIEKHAFAPGNTCVYDNDHCGYSLEDVRLEMSSYGKGDLRDPFVDITFDDGSSTCDFQYDSFVIDDKEPVSDTLPVSYDESGKCEHLCITLVEKIKGVKLHLHYYVYEDSDCICRMSVLENTSDSGIVLKKLMSTQIDFDRMGYMMTTFGGAWAREMQKSSIPLVRGKYINSSRSGESSHRANPFVMLHPVHTSEDAGEVYGFNLIYSGNHYEAAEISPFGKTRFISGINPDGFEFRLSPGEKFESPEAVMSYSSEGFNGLSHHMHRFVREHVVRGEWKKKERPVLLNSWEAAYFDIDERKLVKLAKAGKEVGIELLVMDDGWFGERNDDHSSLGDWDVNPKKLPGGLKSLADKITALGMGFGIWVEPEMISENSGLYEAHPDWAIEIPGRDHSEGRWQRILDLTNPEVCDYIVDKLSKVFSSADISYVKWDMNRTFSDRYSKGLPAERQGEFQHRYYLGLYRVMKELTESFPEILFEGCSAGGNRFDLGILSYFPQIWGSDDTDAMCRIDIQRGYSYGYPASTVGAHVSACPNHQTLNTVPLETRFEVAAAGCFGYELNLCDMSDADKKAITNQVEFYKQNRELFQFGDYYRLPEDGYIIVSKDKTKAVAFVVQKDARPNNDYKCLKTIGLDDDKIYNMVGRVVPHSIKEFGSLINMFTPVHVKQDGIVHGIIDKFMDINGEEQKATALGAAFNGHGVALNSAFCGTGNNDGTRIMRTGDTRLYVFTQA